MKTIIIAMLLVFCGTAKVDAQRSWAGSVLFGISGGNNHSIGHHYQQRYNPYFDDQQMNYLLPNNWGGNVSVGSNNWFLNFSAQWNGYRGRRYYWEDQYNNYYGGVYDTWADWQYNYPGTYYSCNSCGVYYLHGHRHRCREQSQIHIQNCQPPQQVIIIQPPPPTTVIIRRTWIWW